MARDHLRTLRKRKNLSQGALAKAVRLTPAEISRIECGYRDLSLTEARTIADALGVSIEEIVGTSLAPAEARVSNATEPPAGFPAPAPASLAGNDLNDPANFREMPDFDLLHPRDTDDLAFRARVHAAVQRATEVLHTSKVPAAVWRAWRDFERQAHKALQASATDVAVSTTLSESRPNLNNRELLLLAERAFQAGRTSKIKHREKSFNALLFDVAHELLPAELAGKIAAEAERRLRNDRSIGFMRHFRAAIQDHVALAELEKVVSAIQNRESKRMVGHRYVPARPDFN